MKNNQQLLSNGFPVSGRSISFAYLFCIVLLNACSKNNDAPGTASLNIFNGVVGSDILVTNFNGTTPVMWYREANQLAYGYPGTAFPYVTRDNNRFNWYSGLQQIAFFNYPDTLVHSKPVADLQLNLPVGTINSLFLTGTIDAPDTFFIRDQLPYHGITDSSAGIRVVNLVKGFTAGVNLQGHATGSEVAGLGYKNVSAFISYEIKKESGVYVFEIRDQLTGNLVSVQTIDPKDIDTGSGFSNNYRFRNFTIIIYGELNNPGPGALSSAIMSNY